MNIDELKQKRKGLKSSLTRFKTYLSSVNNESNIEELKARLDKIKGVCDQFIEIQCQIAIIEGENDEGSNEVALFEDSFFVALGVANTFINERAARIIQAQEPTNGSSASQSTNVSSFADINTIAGRVKLPTINIPTFSGAYEQWLHFRDTYKSLIHNNATLSKIQKFHYLRSSVSGEAAEQIQSLETSDVNYDIAWDILQGRYENRNLIINSHIDAIFEIAPLKLESYLGIRKIHSSIERHIRSLKAIDVPVDGWDMIIINIIMSKLDPVTLRDWKGVKIASQIPTLKEMLAFLSDRCQMLQGMKNDSAKIIPHATRANATHARQTPKTFFATGSGSCNYCNGSHSTFTCASLIKLPVNSRIEEARKRHLCLNCLRKGHSTRDCKNPGSCQKCGKKHNSLLHLELTNETRISSMPISNSGTASTSTFTACSSVRDNTRVLLATAVVIANDRNGKPIECRALLDSASQSNFISENLCKKLNLSTKAINIKVAGIGQGSTRITKRANLTVNSRLNAFKATLSCLVLPAISPNIPLASFDGGSLNIPDDLRLADPEFYESSEIDMLIGASLFWDLLSQGQIRLGRDLPILQKTHFGWIISGPLPSRNQYNSTLCYFTTTDPVDLQLQKFWEVEDRYLTAKSLTPSDNICENLFNETTNRTTDGRFIVSLPFKPDESIALGDSKETAVSRFLSLERKLNKDTNLKLQYTQFINEYISLGHMAKVSDIDSDSPSYYIPHHPVLKPSSLTTKLRIVFDASAKTTNGKSLNDLLLAGPTIQNDLFSILLRFRKHTFVITSDIAKMYRQVLISEDHRAFQRIIWRFEPNSPLEIYELRTVTYGITSSAFLAIRCLFALAQLHCSDNPLIARITTNDFYVDDLLTGADSLDELSCIQRETADILKKGGFELRKWSSNSPEFLNAIKSDNKADGHFIIGMAEECKTLGLLWDPTADNLLFTVNFNIKGVTITKRQILSCIAQIFDPLGLLAPVTVIVKIMLQKLWQLKLAWDESIPLDLRTRWVSLRDSLSAINNIKIPRHVLSVNPINVQLHAFCDASEAAYGACIYIRSTDAYSNCTIRLLTSKSRVAPLKRLSIPRLELCGALILSELVVKSRESLKMSFHESYFWTDSTIALQWIQAFSSRWKTFVANRVSEIQGLVGNSNWHHVDGKHNPADLLTRGLDPVDLQNSSLWWNGPPWLQSSADQWPRRNSDNEADKECIPEERCLTLVSIDQQNPDMFEKFSDFVRLRRVVAFCLRFIHNLKSAKHQRIIGELKSNELFAATIALSKFIQREHFAKEISILAKGEGLSKKSTLLTLSPFLHEGILRVGGRLKNSNYDFNKKHPILLPKCDITNLIIRNEHERLCHAGPQAVLASLRESFWPIAGRNQVRGVIRKCVICYRAEPKPASIFMGELPMSRVTPSRAFLRVGVDYAGPFSIKDRKTRGAKVTKAYVCLFVCFATRAIHIELVGDLTTQTFISALRRFVSRRGKPSDIYSDNGTNFVGANNELADLTNFLKINANAIEHSIADLDIQWHFIPPRSPHVGGLWEAGVKSSKKHMKRVLGNASLIYEDFYSILVQIEACLNSRPLSPLSNDPNDLLPLTPAHFLVGESLTAVPDPDLCHIPENRLSRFQRMQQLVQHFWKRWSKEYVAELQLRSKWRAKEEPPIKVGSLVLVKEDNIAPLHWKLGRVVELHKGNDNIARVATIRTSPGTIKRALVKLCPLPMEDQDEATHH